MVDFLCFWLRCIPGAWDFAVSEFAGLDIACIAIGSILYFRRNKSHRDAWEKYLEGVVTKYAGILILAQLVLSVFLVAPYVQFHDEQEGKRPAQAMLPNLSGIKFEDAVRALLHTPPPPDAKKGKK